MKANTKHEIALEIAGETCIYQCIHCKRGGLTRDEVTEVKDERKFTHYICDKCMNELRLAGEIHQQLHRDK